MVPPTPRGHYAAYGTSTLLNCVLPLCLLAGAAGALAVRLRVLAHGRAALPAAVWRVLALCPACCACSPAAGAPGGLYNTVAQDDDTVAMDSISFGDDDLPPPAAAAPAPPPAAAPPARADDDDDAAAAPGGGGGATAADAASAAKMTSPFTMAFDDADDDDDSAWKTF